MKKPLLALSFAALAALCAGRAAAGVSIQAWTAPSGARVLFVETRVLPILDVQVDFAAGSAYDVREKSGLAGLTRGLLDAGAGDLDEEKIAERLADVGANLSGGTEPDRASVSLRTLSSERERAAALELLRQVLQSPSFPAGALEREKARTVAGIRESLTRPDGVASRRFSTALYPGHPYGFETTVESVSAIARDDVEGFYRRHYSAARAVVTVVGDVSRSQAEELAQRLTAGLPAGGADGVVPEVTLPSREVVRISHPATQSHIYLGTPALRRGDADFFPLLVGNYVLGGGGFVSRLLKEVREKRGYAYSVYSYFQPLKVEGRFQIGLQTKREQADAALKVVEATLADFLRDGPTETELAAARRNLIDGFALRLDSNRKILDHVAVIGFYGLPLDYLDQYPKKVAAVTRSQIRDAFRRRLQPRHMVTVIVAGG
ncbi:MAG: insulinase family protein [Betaproteobacteria bacterium]|nr:insulinase family protein [Betaproteobacteria bacterium]